MDDVAESGENLDFGRPLSGISTLIRILYNKGDVSPQFNGLVSRYMADCMDVPALMDLSLLLHTTGQMEKGLEMQAAAIQLQRVYRRIHGDGSGLRVLTFMAAGDMTANTPVDFLLEGSNCTLYLAYIDASDVSLPALPDCDICFMAIGESPQSRAVLQTLDKLLRDWTGPPVLNRNIDLILAMTRDGVHKALANEPCIVSPKQVQVTRERLDGLASGLLPLDDICAGASFPVVIRPIGTHAGEDLDKLDQPADLATYLARQGAGLFYLAPFVDYRASDQLFRKQRVVFANGKPFASHMAVSSHWMVHYITAEMDQHAERRDEEQAWMETFDEAFAIRQADAFAALCRAFPLNYFGIDCIEMPDGRLLVFEVDNIMIVHDMDPDDIYPYKKPIMEKVFSGFQTMLADAAGG